MTPADIHTTLCVLPQIVAARMWNAHMSSYGAHLELNIRRQGIVL